MNLENKFKQYKEDLTSDPKIKQEVWTRIESNLPERKGRLFLLNSLQKGLFITIFMIIFGSVFLGTYTLKKSDKQSQEVLPSEETDKAAELSIESDKLNVIEESPEQQDESLDTDAAFGVPREAARIEIESQDKVQEIEISINPSITFIEDIKRGDNFIENLNISYSGPTDTTSLQIEVLELYIDNQTCTYALRKKSTNSAFLWVKIGKTIDIQEDKSVSVPLEISIPENTEEKTYWFAVQIIDRENSYNALYFITIGEERTIECSELNKQND